MKVIYKKSVVEKMDEAILEASSRLSGKKEIEKFVLTEEEHEEFLSCQLPIFYWSVSSPEPQRLCKHRGFKVERED